MTCSPSITRQSLFEGHSCRAKRGEKKLIAMVLCQHCSKFCLCWYVASLDAFVVIVRKEVDA